MKQTKHHRKGAALIMAIVAMAAVTIILSVIVTQVVAQRQMVRQRHRQMQAEWLARAGVELAAARLLQSAEPFKDDDQEFVTDSKVHVAVEKAGDVYVVTVQAEVGLAGPRGVKRDATRLFRRSEKDGVARLEAVTQEK